MRQSTKRCQEGIFLSEIEVFGQGKEVIHVYVVYQISDCRDRQKIDKRVDD